MNGNGIDPPIVVIQPPPRNGIRDGGYCAGDWRSGTDYDASSAASSRVEISSSSPVYSAT